MIDDQKGENGGMGKGERVGTKGTGKANDPDGTDARIETDLRRCSAISLTPVTLIAGVSMFIKTRSPTVDLRSSRKHCMLLPGGKRRDEKDRRERENSVGE